MIVHGINLPCVHTYNVHVNLVKYFFFTVFIWEN